MSGGPGRRNGGTITPCQLWVAIARGEAWTPQDAEAWTNDRAASGLDDLMRQRCANVVARLTGRGRFLGPEAAAEILRQTNHAGSAPIGNAHALSEMLNEAMGMTSAFSGALLSYLAQVDHRRPVSIRDAISYMEGMDPGQRFLWMRLAALAGAEAASLTPEDLGQGIMATKMLAARLERERYGHGSSLAPADRVVRAIEFLDLTVPEKGMRGYRRIPLSDTERPRPTVMAQYAEILVNLRPAVHDEVPDMDRIPSRAPLSTPSSDLPL